MDDDTLTIPTNLGQMVEAAKPALEAIEPDTFVRRTVTRERALELTGVVIESWATVDDDLELEFSKTRVKQRREQVIGLSDQAWVLYAADLQANEVAANTSKAYRTELSGRVAGHDRTLYKWALPLFGDEPVAGATLRDISRGTGRRDDANDVLRLVALFRDAWPQAKGKTPITKAILDRAAADAAEQIALMRPGVPNPALELLNQAYTAWHESYTDLMEAGRYLARKDADVLTRFPGVRSRVIQTGGAGRSEVEGEDDGQVELDEAGASEVVAEPGASEAPVEPEFIA